MSGQLVGEVLDACEAGLKVTQAERLALIAIAEKCHQQTRTGSVRLARIQAAIGQSKRTTERVIAALKERDLVRVVQRGHKSHGEFRAPIYRLPTFVLPPRKVAGACASATASATTVGASATQDGGSPFDRVLGPVGASATQDGGSKPDVLPPNPNVLPPNPNVLPPNRAFASATPPPLTSSSATIDGSNYDGTNDGTNDGSALRAHQSVSAPQATHLPTDVTSRVRNAREESARLRAAYPDQFGEPA